MTLPPLPTGHTIGCGIFNGQKLFTADQMRVYAEQAVAAERDSGGEHPWGEPVYVPCDCKDAEIGRQWRDNSSLEKWFPLTAERLARLEAENAALKHDLQYARDGLTKGRTRMREDNERLAREAHTWSKAAETYAAELERHKPLMQAVEWILEDGHMNQEHLARLRAAWEGA